MFTIFMLIGIICLARIQFGHKRELASFTSPEMRCSRLKRRLLGGRRQMHKWRDLGANHPPERPCQNGK